MILQEALDNVFGVTNSLWYMMTQDYTFPISGRMNEKLHNGRIIMSAIHNLNIEKLPNLFRYTNKLNGLSCSVRIGQNAIKNTLLHGHGGILGNADLWAVIRGSYNYSDDKDIFTAVTKNGYRSINLKAEFEGVGYRGYSSLKFDDVKKMVNIHVDNLIKEFFQLTGLDYFSVSKKKNVDNYIPNIEVWRYRQIRITSELHDYEPRLAKVYVEDNPQNGGDLNRPVTLSDYKIYLKLKKKYIALILDDFEKFFKKFHDEHLVKEKNIILDLTNNWDFDNNFKNTSRKEDDHFDEVILSRYNIAGFIMGHKFLENYGDDPDMKLLKGYNSYIVGDTGEFRDAVRDLMQPPKVIES